MVVAVVEHMLRGRTRLAHASFLYYNHWKPHAPSDVEASKFLAKCFFLNHIMLHCFLMCDGIGER